MEPKSGPDKLMAAIPEAPGVAAHKLGEPPDRPALHAGLRDGLLPGITDYRGVTRQAGYG